MFYIFVIVNKSHEKNKTNNKFPMNMYKYVCVAENWFSLFLCAVDLNCCPKTIEKT